jgi:transposase-like protein
MMFPNAPYFNDEDAAQTFMEQHVWPDGAVCPHCGSSGHIGPLRLAAQRARGRAYKCYDCRKPFTVRIGSIFEASHLPMHLWLRAIYLVGRPGGTRGVDLQRALGVTPKTATALAHRIREAMLRTGLTVGGAPPELGFAPGPSRAEFRGGGDAG